jgi:hypothetical protein
MRLGRAFVLLPLLACSRPPTPSVEGGRIEVSWKGSSSGSWSAPAAAEWCGYRQVLQIRAVRQDTGVALALYPGQAVRPGTFPVAEPARAESLPPAAGVAVRWLAKNQVQGYQGDSGQVKLERSGSGRYSGDFAARVRSVVDTQRVSLSGTFRDLVIARDTVGCQPGDMPPAEAAEAADTAVD